MSLVIGVDAMCWTNRRGFGRFTRSLLGELTVAAAERGHEVVLLGDRATFEDGDTPEGARNELVSLGAAPSEAASAGGSRSARDMYRVMRAARGVGADVFYFPATYTFVPVPGTPIVVTAHDATAERLPELIVPDRLDRWRWAAKQRLALRTARAIITVSDAAREEIIHSLRVRADRVHVINEAPDRLFVDFDHELARRPPCLDAVSGRRYLLYVGGFSPHKNLGGLVRAFDLVLADHRDVALVLAGDADGDPFLSSALAVREAIAATRDSSAIVCTGYVSDEDLAGLYHGAVATVLPSFGEGFGLPVAESLACGTPVIVSDIPALRELAGDAGLYIDPGDDGTIAAAMVRLLEDRHARDELGSRGRTRMASLSWSTAARDVLDVLEDVAST